jgi:hypothetical protein
MENKIVLPVGFEIDLERSKGNEVYMREIPKKEAKTWEEIQKESADSRTQQYVIDGNGSVIFAPIRDSRWSRAHIPSTRIAEKIRALCQMHLIAEYYNRVYGNNWVADYTKENQVKHYPTWRNNTNQLERNCHFLNSGTNPVFATEKILMMAYENNKEIFETALKP